MIIRITENGFKLDEDLYKYARRKLERLEGHLQRPDRATALVELELIEKNEAVPARTCKLRLKFRREELAVSETTQHMYASIDIVITDMERQLKAYRRQHPGLIRGHISRGHGTEPK